MLKDLQYKTHKVMFFFNNFEKLYKILFPGIIIVEYGHTSNLNILFNNIQKVH